jgi:alkylated DNA nucleotide flippase Atl1
MDVVTEIRTIVVAIPYGDVKAYGEIGWELGIAPGRRAGLSHYLTRMCRGGVWFTPMAPPRTVMAEQPNRC